MENIPAIAAERIRVTESSVVGVEVPIEARGCRVSVPRCFAIHQTGHLRWLDRLVIRLQSLSPINDLRNRLSSTKSAALLNGRRNAQVASALLAKVDWPM